LRPKHSADRHDKANKIRIYFDGSHYHQMTKSHGPDVMLKGDT
jgi:hypothetical protein